MTIRQRQLGFTLLEALIALLVLAIGLLGLAGLQARGLSYNTDAVVRSQATFRGYDIMERMRIRRFNTGNNAAGEAIMLAYVVANPDPDPVAVNCTTAVLNNPTINNELICWHESIGQVLPAGVGTIARINNGGTAGLPADDIYQVTISWFDRTGNNNRTQTWTFQP